MADKYVLDAGDKISVKGERITVESTTVVEGSPIPKNDTPQKTYMLKASCPSCKRLIRITDKNWRTTEVRIAITCMHSDNTAHEFVLDTSGQD